MTTAAHETSRQIGMAGDAPSPLSLHNDGVGRGVAASA
jgi:hypothetical protein